MSDAIYLIDPNTKTPTRVEPVDFADIGVNERHDLESWVVAHPELLGERLLVISVEFCRFDRSSKRLDVLALDSEGVLVIVELKLDVAGSHADLQAIRYAAFCSTMTMQDVIEEFASHRHVSSEEAEQIALNFLALDELPELGDRPRIILAAGSVDDQEITSCVLWLRRFGLDISCVEISPYRMPDGGIVLVPKTIIPLPETREYTVQVEKKEVAKVQKSKYQAEAAQLWSLVKSEFNRRDCPLKVGMNSDQQWLVVTGGSTDSVHYAWWWMKREKSIRVGIGFRSKNADENDSRMNLFRQRDQQLSSSLGVRLRFQDDWGPLTRRLYVVVPYDGTVSTEQVAREAAEQMVKLVNLTLPTLAEHDLHPA